MPMFRPRVITAKDVRPAQTGTLGTPEPSPPEDAYLAKVIKYIPVEVVGAYQAGVGIIASLKQPSAVEWPWVIFLFVLCPLWIAFATRERGQSVAWFQAAVAPVAFLAWVFALGGPFKSFAWYEPGLGSLVLVAVPMVLPLLERFIDWFTRTSPS